MNYDGAAGYTFAGICIGSLASTMLGFEGFGVQEIFTVILCAVAAYYFGKSKSQKP